MGNGAFSWFRALHERWLHSLIFSPSGRGESEGGAGGDDPFFAACPLVQAGFPLQVEANEERCSKWKESPKGTCPEVTTRPEP